MKTNIEQYVIDAVKRKRLEKNISQTYLANCLDMSRGFIGDVENPKRPAKYNLNHINDIARLLECSPRELIPEFYFEEPQRKK